MSRTPSAPRPPRRRESILDDELEFAPKGFHYKGEEYGYMSTYHEFRRPRWYEKELDALRKIMAESGADFTWERVAEQLEERTHRPSLRRGAGVMVNNLAHNKTCAAITVQRQWMKMRKQGEPESAAEIAARELVEERRRAEAELFRKHPVYHPGDAPLTEADIPPKPPRLKRNATDAEKAEHEAIVKKRRRVKENLRYQQRKAVSGDSYCGPPLCEWERLAAAAAARRAEAPATEERKKFVFSRHSEATRRRFGFDEFKSAGALVGWRSPEERLAESSRVIEEKLAELRQARIDSSC